MKQNEALNLLDDCEQKLRLLVSEAAREGDYASVTRITDWAKAIASLVKEGKARRLTSENPRGNEALPSKKPTNHALSHAKGVNGRRRTKILDDYPKFFRRGDELVKVGWSKKDGKEYNHRAPRQAIDAVAAALKHAGANGRLFNGDALLPLKDPVSDAAMPDYQAYVALAWFKQLGIVEQRGRRAGYALDASKQIESTVMTEWPELAEWRG